MTSAWKHKGAPNKKLPFLCLASSYVLKYVLVYRLVYNHHDSLHIFVKIYVYIFIGSCLQDNQDQPKDLRSRGLCLVPVSCTQHVGSDNGADYWAPAIGGGF
jgi:hypothetical protein